jgi:hypothetical protein
VANKALATSVKESMMTSEADSSIQVSHFFQSIFFFEIVKSNFLRILGQK